MVRLNGGPDFKNLILISLLKDKCSSFTKGGKWHRL